MAICKKEGKVFKISGAESSDTPNVFLRNQQRLGEVIVIELLSSARADDENGVPYPFRLEDRRNNKIWLSGATSGYQGSGPNATLAIMATPKVKKLLDARGITLNMAKTIVYSCSNFVINKNG